MGTVKKIFVLEDDPDRLAWFKEAYADAELHTTKHLDEARKLLAHNNYDTVYLDHDLGDFDTTLTGYTEHTRSLETGYHLAVWLADRPTVQKNATVIIHSMNPGGAERMWAALMSSRDVAVIPYVLLVKTYIKKQKENNTN